MNTILQDVRFAVRQLRKSPGFACTTILTLALGIGATTAIFSLVNTVLLRPLPFPQQERLISVSEGRELPGQAPGTAGALRPNVLSYPDFFDWRAQNHSFSGLAAYHDNDFTLTGIGDSRHLNGEVVSAEFFRVLGVSPALGRDFRAEDEKPGMHVAILSHELWQNTFAGAPDILNRTINFGGVAYTVAGVMPKGFEFPIHSHAPELWATLATDAVDPAGGEPMTVQRGAHLLDVIGRLKPGVTLSQATADLTVIARNLAAQYPDSNKHTVGAVLKTELDHMVGDTQSGLRVIFAAVCFVLLIACANVAGLLLARASSRRSELALRAALGASRFAVIRQILVESVVLSLCGGAAGIFFAWAVLKALVRLVPEDIPRLNQVAMDAPVLWFAIAVSVVTGLLFGVLPAWRMSRLEPAQALRDGVRSTSDRGQNRLHSALVIAETAVGLILLVGSGLLIRSFIQILHVDPGFDSDHVLTASLDLPENRYSPEKTVQFYSQLLPRLRALPGVKFAGAAGPLPLSSDYIGVTFEVEGRPTSKADQPGAAVSVAYPGFFETMRIPVLRGRSFHDTDTRTSQPVVMISESFAKKYFPGEDPIGKRINPGISDDVTRGMREIIGIVGDIKRRGITAEKAPEFYLPLSQCAVLSPTLVLRTAGDPTSLTGAVRAQVAALDKDVPLYQVRTMRDLVAASSAQPRFQTLLLTCFAVMALLLSAIGLYAVLSFMVVQRTNEIGVRMALGAQRNDVLTMVLRRGLTLAVAGLAIGLIVSFALTRLIATMLYGVKPFDPLTFAVVTCVLLVVSVIASSAPAFRAARLDPMRTLREQ
ncbi:MAG: ABC transporter permease [Acidobacteriaceae bacterium]